MKSETTEWMQIANGDYAVHQYAFESAHYPQAIYLLCQAIEKLLKAAQIEFTSKVPKKIHRLDVIAAESAIVFTKEDSKTLTELSQHYAKVRYPDFAQQDYNTKAKVKPIITKGQTLYLWILEQFKNP